MAFVNKKPVHTQFLKCDNIILPALVIQLIQLCLQVFLCLLHLLNGKILASVPLYFFNPHHNFRNLLFQNDSLPFGTHGNFLKLRMTDNDCIILTRCNSAAELLSVCRFKVFFCGNQNICGRVKLQKLACPLLR